MKKLLLILLLVLAGEISAQQAATIVVKTTPDNEIAYWYTGKEHLFCIALGTKAQAEPLGEFVHQFRTDRPDMVQVWTQGSDSFTLYLTPGSKDTITVTKDTLIISGTNSTYNRCLKTVNDYQKYSDKLVYHAAARTARNHFTGAISPAGRRQNAAGTRRCKCFRTQ